MISGREDLYEILMTKKKAESLSKSIFLRLSPTDLARVDDLAAKFTLTTRCGIVREALRRGLDLINENPTVLVQSMER